jgi:hypothetical protein
MSGRLHARVPAVVKAFAAAAALTVAGAGAAAASR